MTPELGHTGRAQPPGLFPPLRLRFIALPKRFCILIIFYFLVAFISVLKETNTHLQLIRSDSRLTDALCSHGAAGEKSAFGWHLSQLGARGQNSLTLPSTSLGKTRRKKQLESGCLSRSSPVPAECGSGFGKAVCGEIISTGKFPQGSQLSSSSGLESSFSFDLCLAGSISWRCRAGGGCCCQGSCRSPSVGSRETGARSGRWQRGKR